MGDGIGRISGLTQDVINKVNEISEISDYIFIVRKPFLSLVQKLKILIPFFEEIRDNTHQATRNLYYALLSLFYNLETARKLLRQGSKGSKIYLLLERKQIMQEYEAIAALLENDLRRIYYEDHDHISHEVEEHASVALYQFNRAKGTFDQPNDQLYEDLFILYDKGTNVMVDPGILRELVDTLELTSAMHIKIESQALHKMITEFGPESRENIEKMLTVLKLIKEFVQGGNQSLDISSSESPLVDISVRQGIIETNDDNNKETTPNEFLCPISLQLMQDPVVTSSGQTFERTSIERWILAGNEFCPKTRTILENRSLTPNFTLRSVIAQWCEENGIDQRKGVSPTSSNCTPTEYQMINKYTEQLKSHNLQHLRSGAAELSMLSRRSSEVREAIAEAGAIPLLLNLLKSTRNQATQEHTMTTLLNLSICDENKERIVSCGGIPIVIEVMMKSNSGEACEDGAVILYSLSTSDDRKALIGSFGGIKPLVWLLGKGTERGCKDAANALYNLCLISCNKGRAVREGIVKELMIHLKEPQGSLKEEALILLDMMKNRHDVKRALDAEDPVAHLVDIIWSGSQMNQEHATSVLLQLCVGDEHHLEEARKLGVERYLMEMKDFGSERGKKKAVELLEMITDYTGEIWKRARRESDGELETGFRWPRRRRYT